MLSGQLGARLKVSGPQDIDSLPNNTVQRLETTPQNQAAGPTQSPVFNVSLSKNPDGTSWVFLTLNQGKKTKA